MARIPSSQAQPSVSLEQEVDFLRRAEAHGVSGVEVEVVETHKSVVFLVGDLVYKLKKPILFDSVDLRSVERRLVNAQDEVRLNRRLAPDVYLGVVPLSVAADGKLALGGSGVVVDWLVQMRRLPDELMMDWLIRHGTLRNADVDRLAIRLARFYQRAGAVIQDGDAYRASVLREISINRRDLVETASPIDPHGARLALELQVAFVEGNRTLLDRRVAEGHVVEGHGDLRPEHVCLEDEPAIIDCLEFNRSLRIVDAVDELAFLAMQCSLLGAPWVESILFDAYSRVTGDVPPARLISFYTSYRAGIWARLAAWRAREPDAERRERWIERGAVYLDLALASARKAA